MPASYRSLPIHLRLSRWLLAGVLAALAACGGGEGGSDTGSAQPGGSGRPPAASWVAGWAAGIFQPPSVYANLCAAPRSDTHPYSGKPLPDQIGRTLNENNWLRSWTNDNYLWYSEVVDRNPALYATPDYFALLKTSALTPMGASKDRFHFAYPTATWDALLQTGESSGYGIQWTFLQSLSPRELVVAYTEPGSPAAAPGVDVARGAKVLMVNAIDLVNENDPERIDALNAALTPSVAGVNTQFTILDAGATTPRTITLQSTHVTSVPVQNVKTFSGPNGRIVGYMQFNDHVATAELQLAQGMAKLRQEGATELVVDLRYNGGGLLSIASQLAYMIAGENNTHAKVFERTVFNDKVEASGNGASPIPFYAKGLGNSAPVGMLLPSLDLRRVYVLTGPDTCSASESIINGLRGIDTEVVQIGATTCGKPYGFYPTDNCGTTYFSVAFKGENAKGFSDYADGMPPTCAVPDDFEHVLGDPREARMAAALTHMTTGACPAAPAARGRSQATTSLARTAPLLRKPVGLSNRILQTR